ncbi:hypothetical protein [Halomarina oriensis]|uniref:Uncharacterized protein n=1 Tax=Halomarina oriensis TaxID=671145 RepID=A0A6B0GEP6_9EURY|nr:hypothetical protein [Halomarina oriensis]MWG33010.1 hypothetical protein [Halomarina oriensis]
MSMELAVTRVAVRLWVPRGAAGDLAGGAQQVLDDAQAIDRIETLDVTGFRPTATDIRVDLDARVVLAPGDDAAAIGDAFGILEVEVDA